MITIGKTKSVCPECMKVVPAQKCIGEDGIYLVKECNVHGKFLKQIYNSNVIQVQKYILGREMQQIIFPGEEKISQQKLL